MIKLKVTAGTGVDALRAVLSRVGQVTQLIRPAPTVPPTPYVRCATCGKSGRDDQQVPDPDQFVKVKKGTTPGAEKAEGDVRLIDAAPVWCGSCLEWHHAIGCYSVHRHTD